MSLAPLLLLASWLWRRVSLLVRGGRAMWLALTVTGTGGRAGCARCACCWPAGIGSGRADSWWAASMCICGWMA